MMMVLKIVTATLGDDVKVVMTARPYLARADEGTVERIVWIVHLIHPEHCFKAGLVECLVMGYKRQSFYLWFNLLPYVRKDRCFLCIFTAETVYTGADTVIIVRLWMNKRVELVYFLSISDNHHTN